MAANNKRLSKPYNSEELLKSLIKRLKECADFAAAAIEPASETQLVRITYRLVA